MLAIQTASKRPCMRRYACQRHPLRDFLFFIVGIRARYASCCCFVSLRIISQQQGPVTTRRRLHCCLAPSIDAPFPAQVGGARSLPQGPGFEAVDVGLN